MEPDKIFTLSGSATTSPNLRGGSDLLLCHLAIQVGRLHQQVLVLFAEVLEGTQHRVGGGWWPRPQRLVSRTISQRASMVARSAAVASRLRIFDSMA